MQIHELQPIHRLKRPKRVGRGGKRGTYSGRGIKGQKSRAGRKLKDMVREMILKLPKKRGEKFGPIHGKSLPVTLETLEKVFSHGEKITPRTLLEKGIISRVAGRIPSVKIVGGKELKKGLIVVGVPLSRSAREKIEKAGGKIIENLHP